MIKSYIEELQQNVTSSPWHYVGEPAELYRSSYYLCCKHTDAFGANSETSIGKSMFKGLKKLVQI